MVKLSLEIKWLLVGSFPAFSACSLAGSPTGQTMEYFLGALLEELKGFNAHACFGFWVGFFATSF